MFAAARTLLDFLPTQRDNSSHLMVMRRQLSIICSCVGLLWGFGLSRTRTPAGGEKIDPGRLDP
jgi:hypothetical protein